MDHKGLTLNEIYAIFDTLPRICPVCGESLYYGVAISPGYDYVTLFVSCGSGGVFPNVLRHDCVEKRDLEYLIFDLSHDHPKIWT